MIKCNKCGSYNIEISRNYQFFNRFDCKTCGYWTYKRIEDCCREPFDIVVIKRNDNSSFLYKQCINCGGSINRTKPLSYKKFGDEIRDEFNEDRYNEWREKIEIERMILIKMKQEYNHYNSPRYKYYKYLSSAKWKNKREQVLKRDKNLCQICGKKIANEVHHLTYINLGNEKMSDLISICRDCHKKIHGIK